MKPKFDKQKCLTCKYSAKSINIGYPTRTDKGIRNVYCAYMLKTGKTTLKARGKRGTYDLRGNDYHNCKLYKEDEHV